MQTASGLGSQRRWQESSQPIRERRRIARRFEHRDAASCREHLIRRPRRQVTAVRGQLAGTARHRGPVSAPGPCDRTVIHG